MQIKLRPKPKRKQLWRKSWTKINIFLNIEIWHNYSTPLIYAIWSLFTGYVCSDIHQHGSTWQMGPERNGGALAKETYNDQVSGDDIWFPQ